MRKPNYGKDITIHWEGIRSLGDVLLVKTGSTLLIGEGAKKEMEDSWNEHLKLKPTDHDGNLWRFEKALESANKLMVNASPTTFSAHAYLRGQELPDGNYPNPLGITVLQVTSDKYAIAGVHSDGRGIVPLESRFIERGKDTDIIETLLRPDKRETRYRDGSFFTGEYLKKKASVMAVITGSLHDTGIVIYAPVPQTISEVGLNSKKHTWFVPIKMTRTGIERLIETGTYEGKQAADQLIGALGMFLKNERYFKAAI